MEKPYKYIVCIYDPMTFLKVKEKQIRKILKEELKKRRMFKFYITLQVRFTKNKGDQVEITEPYFSRISIADCFEDDGEPPLDSSGK